MINFNTTASNLTRKILRFSEKVSKGLKRPEFKLISDMLYGLLAAQSCKLSEIARSLDEKTTLKKVIKRLALGLARFENAEVVQENFLEIAKKEADEDTILIVDGGDINKDNGKKFENLCKVRDGSTFGGLLWLRR